MQTRHFRKDIRHNRGVITMKSPQTLEEAAIELVIAIGELALSIGRSLKLDKLLNWLEIKLRKIF